MKLKVKLSILIEVDSSIAQDLVNGWNISGNKTTLMFHLVSFRKEHCWPELPSEENEKQHNWI